MAIKDATAKVLNNVDILDVIGEDTHLVRQGSGDEYMGSCPFHTDRHPSLSVNGKKQVFHCFSCGRSGNVISYIEERDNVSFFEALTKLANDYDISLDGILSQEDAEVSKKRQAYYDLLQAAQDYFVEQLPKHQEELDYLTKTRKLTPEAIERFGIGFDDGELYKYLSDSEHGYLLTELSENGLIRLSNHNVQDFFSQRITFPLKDERGYVVGFSARSLHEKPKYRNSGNNQFFTKNQIIYNFFDTKEELKDSNSKKVYLFEGQNDVISAVMAGKKNAIASLGTALTDNQILKVLKLTDDIIISYDGDEAGQHAIKRAANNFKIINPMVKLSVVQLPDNLDPDDYRRKYGTDSLAEELDKTQPIVEYLIQPEFEKYYKETQQTIPDRSRLYNKALEIIHHFANDVEQQMYIQYLNDALNIQGSTATVETKPIQKYDDNDFKSSPKTDTTETVIKHDNNRQINTVENKLLSYIVNNPDIFDDNNIRLATQYFRNSDYKNILQSLFMPNIKLNEYQKLLLENARNNSINFTYDSFLQTLKSMYDNFDYETALHQVQSQIKEALANNDQDTLINLLQEEIAIKKAKN